MNARYDFDRLVEVFVGFAAERGLDKGPNNENKGSNWVSSTEKPKFQAFLSFEGCAHETNRGRRFTEVSG